MYIYPEFRCPIEAMGLIAIVFSLLSMWIALGRGRWFFRAAVGVALIGMLVPPRADQPIVLFSASSVASILILVILRIPNHSSLGSGRRRPIPSFFRRTEIWLGLVAGTLVGLSFVGWAVRSYWAFGWLEALLLFALAVSAVLSVALVFADRFRERARKVLRVESERLSFDLRDVLLAFTLLAVLFALIAFAQEKRPPTHWMSLATIAAIMTSITVSVCGLVTATRYRWRALSLLVLTSSVGSTFRFKSDLESWLTTLSPFGPTRGAPWGQIVSVYVLALATATLLMWLAGYLSKGQSPESPVRSGGHLSQALSVVLAVLIAACVVPIGVEMSRPLPQPDRLDGDSEVYDALASEAAAAVAVNPYGKTEDELRKAGSVQKAILVARSHEGMRRQSRQVFQAPDPLAREWNINSIRDDLVALRGWVGIVRREAQNDQANERFVAASERWNDCIHLGSGLTRGGDLSYALAGIGIESTGHEGLSSIRQNLPIEQIAQVLPELIRIDSIRERSISIKRRADRLFEYEMGWRFRLAISAPHHLSSEGREDTRSIVSPAIETVFDAIQRRDATHRLLLADFAIRLFIEKIGRSPNGLDELVPRFLPAIPIDPYSGKTLIYVQPDESLGDADFVVYSVGIDGKDDDGFFGDATTLYEESYDFDLDGLDRPANQKVPRGGMGGVGPAAEGER